ncbi:MAG TPA: hypothetical protein VGD98_19685 [Ktedonobacteraceae bacterium]
MRKLFHVLGSCVALLALLLITSAGTGLNATASTQTLAVGPYIIDFSLSQNPPPVDTPLDVTITPHDSNAHLQGDITTEPGLGTDGTSLRFHLSATGEANGTLRTTIHIPVRGAWNIAITLTGSRGQATSQVAVTAAAPGAIPVWLGWLIGASPLVIVAFWIWRQHRYKRALLSKTTASPVASD